jgi:putative Mn2+ efflux pump MntP
MDSLTVGFAMALTHTNVSALAAVNGVTCALLSLAGILLGERVGETFPAQSKIAAGLVLILVGLRALVVHP